MRRILIAVSLMLAVALAAGCSGSGDAVSSDAEAPEALGAEQAPAAPDDAGREEAAGGGSAADTDTSVPGEAPPVADLVAAQDSRIVREGTMRVEVDGGTFDRAFNQVVAAATRHGGTVAASDASSDDEGLTSGSVTVRVPAESYDALLTSVTEIGEVRDRSITSQDVSEEFVDLEARLRHNEAQERFYLSLLEDAEGVEDAIAVQQRVSEIQQTIEQIRGRLTFLEERTSFSRLTVELFETGSAFQQGGETPTFTQYWEASRNALVNVLGVTMVLVTILLPFAAVGALIFFIVRRVRPRRRRTLPPPGPPAQPAPEPATSGAPAGPDA